MEDPAERMAKQAKMLLVTELFELRLRSWVSYDGTSADDIPLATTDHYDRFARALVCFVRTTSNEEEAVQLVREFLPAIEQGMVMRIENLKDERRRQTDPECGGLLDRLSTMQAPDVPAWLHRIQPDEFFPDKPPFAEP